jgi:hypothetical protein
LDATAIREEPMMNHHNNNECGAPVNNNLGDQE